MYIAGIDAGARFVKVVVLDTESGRLLGSAKEPARYAPGHAAQAALDTVLGELGASEESLAAVYATGDGAADCRADATPREVESYMAGLLALALRGGMLLDVGAESTRVLRMTAAGQPEAFLSNDKCAAGAGSYVESMARVLEVSLEELDALALRSLQPVPLTSQCAVFAESEVVSLLHRNTDPADIARAIFESLAKQSAALMRRAGLSEPIRLAGGLAQNRAFVQALERELAPNRLQVIAEPLYLSAYGAAALARDFLHGART